MSKQSLGLIETVGLAAAIEAADAALKSANVGLIGYELSQGGGMAVVKVAGEIGSVQAAVAAASAAASNVNAVFSTKVIARPADGIAGLTVNGQTVGAASRMKQGAEPAEEIASQAPEKVLEAAAADQSTTGESDMDELISAATATVASFSTPKMEDIAESAKVPAEKTPAKPKSKANSKPTASKSPKRAAAGKDKQKK